MDHDVQNTECLYDFLYVDRERVKSYYAQLFDEGVLTGIKSISKSETTKSASFKDMLVS